MNYGFNVRIKFKKDSPFGAVEETRHNVTEIHYNYETFNNVRGKMIAFESDIHGTGGTLQMDYIEEFEATIAIKKEEQY